MKTEIPIVSVKSVSMGKEGNHKETHCQDVWET